MEPEPGLVHPDLCETLHIILSNFSPRAADLGTERPEAEGGGE